MAFGADFAHGFVDDALQFVRVGIGVVFPDVLHRAMKHVPTDGLLDEFREGAFFGPLCAKVSAQCEVDLSRYLNIPANCGFFFHRATYTLKQISIYFHYKLWGLKMVASLKPLIKRCYHEFKRTARVPILVNPGGQGVEQ